MFQLEMQNLQFFKFTKSTITSAGIFPWLVSLHVVNTT